jgi:hypothetical protein
MKVETHLQLFKLTSLTFFASVLGSPQTLQRVVTRAIKFSSNASYFFILSQPVPNCLFLHENL